MPIEFWIGVALAPFALAAIVVWAVHEMRPARGDADGVRGVPPDGTQDLFDHDPSASTGRAGRRRGGGGL